MTDRISYRDVLLEAANYAEVRVVDCDECDDDSCERCVAIVAHTAALRQLAALVEEAENEELIFSEYCPECGRTALYDGPRRDRPRFCERCTAKYPPVTDLLSLLAAGFTEHPVADRNG